MTTSLKHICFFVIISPVVLNSQWIRPYALQLDKLVIGNVSVPLTNVGNINYNVGGVQWNIDGQSEETIVFDHGLNIIGKVNDTVKTLLNCWYSPFSPGPIIDGVPAIRSDKQEWSRYKIYTLTRGDEVTQSPRLDDWPNDLGAPVDSLSRPTLYGDQMKWMVFNGADAGSRPYYLRHDTVQSVLPIEVRHSVYSYASAPYGFPAIVNDVVFLEWEMINKGNDEIDSCFFGFFTDIDFNNADNPPAVDTSLQLGYCWTPHDTTFYIVYRDTIPDTVFVVEQPITVGYALLFGPTVSSISDTATVSTGSVTGRKNLPMYSFFGFGDDSYFYGMEPPYSVSSAWSVARGFDQHGNVKFDSTAGKATRYSFPGDPVTGLGWIFPPLRTSGGAGFMMYSGPLTFAPSDTQWMMMALIPTLGRNRFESIKNLRFKTQILQELSLDEIRGRGFDWNAPTARNIFQPVYHELHQNYPNPFNPKTTFTYDVGVEADVEISVYTVLGQKIATLVDERKPIGRYTIDFDADGLASGIYICRMKVDYLFLERKMVVLR